MDAFWELLRDNDSILGRLVTTGMLLLTAAVGAAVAGRVVVRRSSDPYTRYYLRKAVRYLVLVLLVVALAVVWRPFAGRLGVVLGLTGAGVAFAMQEVIGAFAGWVSILSSRQYRAGDRIQMGGVIGDVLDITPLRTKLLEVGAPPEVTTAQGTPGYTGRIVSVSNKAIFTAPVYNSSSGFEYVWQELTLPVPYQQDWQQAERILLEEAERASASGGAREAMAQMRQRYPVGRAEVEPRVFLRATDNWVELSARFVVPVREARLAKDEMSRRVLDRFREAGLSVASTTQDVTVRRPSE